MLIIYLEVFANYLDLDISELSRAAWFVIPDYVRQTTSKWATGWGIEY